MINIIVWLMIVHYQAEEHILDKQPASREAKWFVVRQNKFTSKAPFERPCSKANTEHSEETGWLLAAGCK